MRLTIKNAASEVQGVWVAKTRRGFNAQQRREIAATQRRMQQESQPAPAPKLTYLQQALAEMIRDTRTNAIPDVLPGYPADVEWTRDHIAHIMNVLTKADKNLSERVWCEFLRSEKRAIITAMLHEDGDWSEVPLSQALEMVAQGTAEEMVGESVAHYDDGKRTFDKL